MKNFFSFLICLLVGVAIYSITTFATPIRGKPEITCQTATFQPFQEQAEFEKDIGSNHRFFTFSQTQPNYKKDNRINKRIRQKPEIVLLN